MPQTITTGYKALLEAAEREIETLSVDDAAKLHGHDDVVFVDIRDPREQQREGKMPGAFSCTRGMLEFWIDPESPYHKDVFAQDKFVFFCAGGCFGARRADPQHMGKRSRIKGDFPNGRRPASRWLCRRKRRVAARGIIAALIERSRHFACRRPAQCCGVRLRGRMDLYHLVRPEARCRGCRAARGTRKYLGYRNPGDRERA
jgi:rhodanese-related sulfurtransferase